MPIIPDTQEAKAELLEPRKRRLQLAEIAPLNSSLGKNKAPSQKKKKKSINDNFKETKGGDDSNTILRDCR